MTGTRRDRPDNSLFEPGEYGKLSDGSWCACSPNGHHANLSGHRVEEHEDGTITVTPSILIWLPATDETPRADLYHGFLERGVWRDA